MTFTLLIPTLNEVIGVKAIMPKIPKELVDQILFVDGGSTDGTIEWLKDNNYEVHIQTKPGIRNAYSEVLDKIRSDYIITFSPDGNCLPEDIKTLIDKVHETGADMIMASRYFGGAKSDDDDIVTGFGNWLFTSTINLLFNANYTDAMGIYRVYRKDLIYKLELNKDEHYNIVEKLYRTKISWEPLLSARAAKMKLKIFEIGSDEPKRIGGDRKLQVIKWGAAYYTQFLLEFFSSKFWKK